MRDSRFRQRLQIHRRLQFPLRPALLLFSALLTCVALNGCIVIGYHSHPGGFFLWPRGLGLLVMVILVIALMRPRRW